MVALDIHKAYDNLKHETILSKLANSGCGQRMYIYVQDFLTNRTASINMPHETTPTFYLNRGTPQGSIISPTLFNLAMADLPRYLNEIPDLHHSIYADDITLWTAQGNPGQIEETLQRGCDAVEVYTSTIGLTLSPSKTQLLVTSSKRGPDPDRKLIKIKLQDKEIQQVDQTKILGVVFQFNGKPEGSLNCLHAQINQIAHLIQRTTNHRTGLKEHNLLHIIDAFVISRLLYTLPYLTTTCTQIKKLEASLRKLYRLALGVPRHASSERLLNTGTFNTITEPIQMHKDGQILRLSTSNQGRTILQTLDISTDSLPPIAIPPPPWKSANPNVTVEPLPKNMNPDNNPERRKLRAKAHEKRIRYLHETDHDTYFADASHQVTHGKIAFVNTRTKIHYSETFTKPPTIDDLEEYAIAKAMEHAAQQPTLIPR
ncbi:hypothetical protein HPB47_016280 [Ixodes persulcatus]|uniref:Uncharacterized protein n=1 Tax=Ixodes persulcatus TaxID=34615 RepID=A0AC60R096_IXOPE|nr:hypothetical protein HPB47_016280 [Ixodes persulcatus]